MEAVVKKVGTIEIRQSTPCEDARGNCDCGALAHYKRLDTADKLLGTVRNYATVVRPTGQRVTARQGGYTFRMAANDLQRV